MIDITHQVSPPHWYFFLGKTVDFHAIRHVQSVFAAVNNDWTLDAHADASEQAFQ